MKWKGQFIQHRCSSDIYYNQTANESDDHQRVVNKEVHGGHLLPHHVSCNVQEKTTGNNGTASIKDARAYPHSACHVIQVLHQLSPAVASKKHGKGD